MHVRSLALTDDGQGHKNKQGTHMKFDFSGKTVLVTGATSGIGRQTALSFAEAGANLVLAGRRADKGNAVADEVKKLGVKALFVQTDVSKEDQVATLVEKTVSTFGGLDVAFNNAGVVDNGVKPVIDRTSAEFDAVFNTNVRGLFYCLKYQIPVMRKARKGAIVNNASTLGQTAVGGLAFYVAAKHAIVGMTKSVSLENAPFGIRINALLPDSTESDIIEAALGPPGSAARKEFEKLIPLRRYAAASEQANVVMFLASEGASFITGATLAADGGRLAGVNLLQEI